MSLRVPPLETDRLLIRELREEDSVDIHHILDEEIDLVGGVSIERRRRWLQWSIMAYSELDDLNQPPYVDRAVVLRGPGELIGVTGYAPMFHPISDVLSGKSTADALWLPEIGIYYALSPRYQRRGYATEAAGALIRYAFSTFKLKRIVANTDFANAASIGVMRKLGMKIYRNESGDPPWFEILGVIDHP